MKNIKRSNELPIDRGWSWVICFASFVCMFLMGTSLQALSILFLELVSEFGSTVTVTSLTVMCFVMSLSVSSVVSTSVLIPIFGERPVVAVSGAIFAACSIGYYLAPNIIVFIVFSAGKGMSAGMIFVPSVSLISFYFNKRRSLATTISNSGVCVASIVSPPIIRAITSYYGMRGTFLILAAFELNMVAAGLLMRPISSYKAVRREDTHLTTLAEDESALITKTSQQHKEDFQSDPSTDKDQTQNLPSNSPSRKNYIYRPTNPAETNGSSVLRNDFYDSVDTRFNGEQFQISENQEFLEKDHTLTDKNTVTRQNSRKGSFPRKGSLGQHSLRGSDWSLNNKQRDQVLHHQSMLSVTSGLEPGVAGVGLHGQVKDEVGDKGWKSCCCISIIRRIFDPHLFSQWSYRLFLLSCIPSATTQYLLQYIPTIAVIKGATKDEAATLLTIIGSVDLVSRLAVGVLADTRILKTTQIVAIAQICQGILCQFNPLFDNFEKMIAMVVFMGLFIGTRQSLIAMMHIEIVGMEKMSRCLSLSAMVATISAACHSPMLSAVLEATGSYNIVLHYVGVALIVGAVMILLAPLLAKVDARRAAKSSAA